MTAPKTPTKTDQEIIAEHLTAAAKKYNLCDAFYSEMDALNKKLAAPLPVVRGETINYTVMITAEHSGFKPGPDGLRVGVVNALEKELKKAVVEFFANYKPKDGEVKADIAVEWEGYY